ncbi:histone H4 transcription factor-like [Engraulis encrasicolus]|uniref:histone H4 transcription factor-like n=1 Tax=Engraulis encrasicolus TaxID=184585 RepID=UPI002FD53CBD
MAMPVAKRARRQDVTLELRCEWGACQETFCNMRDFCIHVEEHHQELTRFTTTGEFEAEDRLSCQWRDCGIMADSGEELKRHALFHCHHTKLKQWGEAALKTQPDLGACIVGSHNRNILPPTPGHGHLTCLWEHCGMTLDNPELYYRHVDNHAQAVNVSSTEKQAKVFQCGWTDCKFVTRNGLFKLCEHLRSHTREKIAACPRCGGMFANNTKLFDHIRSQTATEDLRFKCAHCQRRYASEKFLRKHLVIHVRAHRCTMCEMTCPTPSALRNHMRFRHSTERPHRCGICPYSCVNLNDLQKHLDTHNQEPIYECHHDNCDFAARAMDALTRHYKKAHLKQQSPWYQCHLCEQSFTRGNNLTIHLEKKHQLKSHSRLKYMLHPDGFMRLLMNPTDTAGLTRQSCEAEGRDSDQPAALGSLSSSNLRKRGQKRKLDDVEGGSGSAHQYPQDEDSQPGLYGHQSIITHNANDGRREELGTVVVQPVDYAMKEYVEGVSHSLMLEDSDVYQLACEDEDSLGRLCIVVPVQCDESLESLLMG